MSSAEFDPFEFSSHIRQRVPKPKRIMAPSTWYGGKNVIANWIVEHIPRGKVYVEAYAGMLSVLMHLDPPFPVEVVNDLNGFVVNFFRTLQDPEKFSELAHRLTNTPYALDEFRKALSIVREASKKVEDAAEEGNVLQWGGDVDLAWACYVMWNQGFSGIARSEGNWSRTFTSSGGMAYTASKWLKRLGMLEWWYFRLMRTQIDHRDGMKVIEYWDTPETVFYLDPPYVSSTRRRKKMYDVETDDNYHERLVKLLLEVEGMVVLSGYPNEIYKLLEQNGWLVLYKHTTAHAIGRTRSGGFRGKKALGDIGRRVEALWINPQAQEALRRQGKLPS